MMKLGDFFASAPHAQPVNPHPVMVLAESHKTTLPGNHKNPEGRQVQAKIQAAMIFLPADGSLEIPLAAREALEEKYKDEDGNPRTIHPYQLGVETDCQFLWRVLFEYDAQTCKVGNRMFPSVDLLRELVKLEEISRLVKEYQKYVADQHKEVLDAETFRESESGGRGLAAAASR